MNMNYKLVNGPDEKLVGVFEPTVGCIPINPANTDYQAYLEWVEDGNTPEAAD
tara:strand:+ start:357 stop:515 length:159 start_codon:yes stop_codon:yes gene_type:complete